MSLTDDDYAALEYAARPCYCESYYRYTCGKCRQAAELKAPDVTRMVKAGLVTWEGYGAPNLTDEGEKQWKNRRG